MKYRHKKSGKVIELKSVINDKDWELIPSPKTTSKTSSKKKEKEVK